MKQLRFGLRFGSTLTLGALLLATVFSAPAHGALPPGYGGVLRVPGTSDLRLPSPRTISTPLEAALAHAVFDTLYRVEQSGVPTPSLAAALPTIADDVATIRLRPGIRRHDRRPLRARDVAQALRRADREGATPWFAGIKRRNGQLDITAPDDTTLAIRLEDIEMPLAHRLASTPTSIALGRGHGTGPFRARLRGGVLRLAQFRTASRGAPYLRGVEVHTPRDRESELRAFELGELDLSWRGSSLYGRTNRNVERHTLPALTPVLLIPHRSQRDRLGALERAIDRRRLARVGMTPSDTLASGLPSSSVPGSRTGAVRLLVVSGDPFQQELARALIARFDELGWTTSLVPVSADRLAQTQRGNGWDLRIAQVPPPLPGNRALVASAWIATGDSGTATQILSGATSIQDGAATLPAIVLGHRARNMFHLPDLLGGGHDSLGRLRFEDLFFPRTRTAGQVR